MFRTGSIDFYEKLNKAREMGGFEMYRYCLMGNYVYLLIKEGEEMGISIKWMTNIRQLSRVLGLGKMIVEQALKR